MGEEFAITSEETTHDPTWASLVCPPDSRYCWYWQYPPPPSSSLRKNARIDSAAVAVLAGTGAPSASVAVGEAGYVYEQAYGEGRIGRRRHQPCDTPSVR